MKETNQSAKINENKKIGILKKILLFFKKT